MRSCVENVADTDVAVDLVLTLAIYARVRFTFVNIDIAIDACPPGITYAFVHVDVVLTLPVDTWVGGTLVDLSFAVDASKAW